MSRSQLRTAVLALVCVLAVGCSGGADPAASDASGGPPAERAYWPTEDWRTDAPEDHGFDADELAEVEGLVRRSYPNVRSIAIVRDGYLVYERYWQGVDAEDGHDVRSVTKSVVSALIGIALADGSIESLDETVDDLLPEHLPAEADPRWAQVTLTHLLTMTSGLQSDALGRGGDESLREAMLQSPDWVRNVLGRQLVADPGARFAYSDATSHLLSAIVAESTGQSTLAFARERLFEPLGISTADAYEPEIGGPDTPEAEQEFAQYLAAPVAWPVDPQGYHVGGAFLKLPTRDLARFGYLYLNDGRWGDEQIVPADYVRASTSPSVSTPDGSADYGWQWWVPSEDDDGSFFALGYGGQTIYVDPALDLVTVVTSDPETPHGQANHLVESAVIPAARD